MYFRLGEIRGRRLGCEEMGETNLVLVFGGIKGICITGLPGLVTGCVFGMFLAYCAAVS